MGYSPEQFIQPSVATAERKVEQFVPTLFIGLGGTGKNTLMHLRKRFYDTYADHRRDIVRYLIIDTDMKRWWPGDDNRREDYLPVKPGEDEQVDCQISDAEFYQVFDQLEKQDDPRYISWLKPGMSKYGTKAIKDGAGQHRQFGRMAFMLNYPKIRLKIENHIESLLKTVANSTAAESEATVEKNTVEVVIVTSLAGGTGSGMFIDVAYLVKDIVATNDYLRAMRKGQYSTLISVMPSAFKGGDESAYSRLQQNAYAGLLELEYYGSAESGDELFIGNVKDDRYSRHRVGFVAPWKSESEKFIVGHGWEACYLVDNATPLTLHQRQSGDESYQMIADYLFLDFERSEFAVQKRSNRCNLAQYQQGYIENRVKRGNAAVGDGKGAYEGTDTVFATRNSCSFNSLGIAEIAFDKEGIYRAASYRLAANLIATRWLGAPGLLQQSEYEALARRDLLQPDAQSSAPSFERGALSRQLYAKGGGNFLAAAEDDLNKVRLRPYSEGSAEIAKLEAAHLQRLSRSPKGKGIAVQNVDERRATFVGDASILGPLRERLRALLAIRINEYGVAVARELIEYYRRILLDEAEKARAVEAGEGGGMFQALARLREADSIPIPGRRIAQRIEFPRACDGAQQWIIAHYHRNAAPAIRALYQASDEFLGHKDREIPRDLDDHRTLFEMAERAKKRLDSLLVRLGERFVQSRMGSGTDRMQSLLPTEWDEARYDDRIFAALTKEFKATDTAGQSRGIDWGKLSDRVFETLKSDMPNAYGEVLSLSHLLDKWAKGHVQSPEDIGAVAEVLARACRKILVRAEINFKELQGGSVLDILMSYENSVRERRIDNLIKFGAPYLPLDAQAQAAITGNYQMKFQNLLGTREGELGEKSRANKEQVLSQIGQRSGSLLPAQGKIERPLDSTPTSLIMCREVWGVPLQFYSFLNSLFNAYKKSVVQDELHINCHQKMADLPDIRVITPDTYEKIRDNVDHVLLAMIRGMIAWNKDCFWVYLPNEIGHGFNPVPVGSRISGIVKHCCDDSGIREFLIRSRTEWENSAKPRDWAIVYVSASKTYDFAVQNVAKVSPLRNCFRILVQRMRDRLQETEEGRKWYELLRPRQSLQDSPEQIARQKAAFEQIERDGLLTRASDLVPIFEVNWEKVAAWTLPPEA